MTSDPRRHGAGAGRDAEDRLRVPELQLRVQNGGGDYNAGKDMLSARSTPRRSRGSIGSSRQKGANADGALYWKAYAQFKLGKTDDALATIAQLRKDYPQSRYLRDAKVLEADARADGRPAGESGVDGRR